MYINIYKCIYINYIYIILSYPGAKFGTIEFRQIGINHIKIDNCAQIFRIFLPTKLSVALKVD